MDQTLTKRLGKVRELANAVATALLEELARAASNGFDQSRIAKVIGPKSKAYIEAWNAFGSR